MAKSQAEISKLIERVKEQNTRYKVASENNVPVIARIKTYISALEGLNLDAPRLAHYKDNIIKVVQDSYTLVEEGDFFSYSEKVSHKEQLVTLLEQIVDSMYDRMERELNESRS